MLPSLKNYTLSAAIQFRHCQFREAILKSLTYFLIRWLPALFILTFGVPGHANQLLANPGFELDGAPANRCGGSAPNITGTVGTGWLDNTCWAGAGTSITYSLDTTNPHSGQYSQKVVLTSGTVQLVSVPAAPSSSNNAYNFSVWLRSNSASMPISVTLTEIGAPYTTYGGQTVNVGTTWTRYDFVMPAPAQSAWIVIQSYTPGTFWIDDASVLANPELISNPGFEGLSQTDSTACSTAGGSTSISANLANGWSCWASSGNIAAQISSDTSTDHGGSTSQEVNVDALNDGTLFLQQYGMPVQTGNLYTASVWMKSSSGVVPVEIGLNTPDGQATFATMRANVTSTWTQFILNAQVGPAPAGVRLYIAPLQTGTIWVDDASLSGQTPASQASPPAAAIPNSYFGMHELLQSDPAPYAQLPSGQTAKIPYGARRLWDTQGAVWMTIATSPTSYDWSKLDAIVADAAVSGYDLVMDLGAPPQWASARPNEASINGYPGSSAEPASMTIWTNWVTAVATRYNGQIKYWEIWNEPNFPSAPNSFFTGTPETLLALQQSAYQTLKAINANNVVLTPAMDSFDYWTYYAGIGGTASADILAFHYYSAGAPEPLYQYIAPNMAIISSNFANVLPMWNTEGGWLAATPPLASDLQAAYLARAYILNWAANAQRYYFYAWDDSNLGVTTTLQNGNVTPAGNAYYWVMQWLVGSVMNSVYVDANGNWIVTLTGGNGAVSHIVWNPGATSVSYSIPGDWSVHNIQTLAGATSSAAPQGSISVGPSPLLIY